MSEYDKFTFFEYISFFYGLPKDLSDRILRIYYIKSLVPWGFGYRSVSKKCFVGLEGTAFLNWWDEYLS